jgi:xanthine dehydrogenase accessory factor
VTCHHDDVVDARRREGGESALEQALRLRARYVGVMASRAKRARMQAALHEAGFDDEAIGGVHSPIGLAIGAETPAELAVSIAAEIVRVRAGTEA